MTVKATKFDGNSTNLADSQFETIEYLHEKDIVIPIFTHKITFSFANTYVICESNSAGSG